MKKENIEVIDRQEREGNVKQDDIVGDWFNGEAEEETVLAESVGQC